MIDGNTILIAHLGYPTASFKAPMIYNPYFESIGFNAVVVPMGVRADDYPACLRTLSRLTNLRGALVTMPHKVTTVGLVDEVSTAGQIAGACNAILLRPDGTPAGRHVRRRGLRARHAAQGPRRRREHRALVVGSGGVGSAIAASLAGAGVARLGLFDVNAASARGARRQAARRTIPASSWQSARKTLKATTSSSTRRRSA